MLREGPAGARASSVTTAWRPVVAVARELRRIVTGEYHEVAAASMRMVRRCEAEFGFASGVRRVIVLPGPRGGYYYPRDAWLLGGVIRIHAARPRSRELREYTYHELGHAICDRHDVRAFLAPFTRRTQRDRRAYLDAAAAAVHAPRRAGFVSGYATCNREEDFCETLAAYLCNRGSWRTRVRFDGRTLDVARDARLRAKLDAVDRLLRALRRLP